MIEKPLTLIKQRLAELYPPQIDTYPEPMRASILRMRRTVRIRQYISIVLGIFSYAAKGALIIGAGLVLAWATDRDPPLEANVEILSRTVPAGNKLSMRVEGSWKRLCKTKVNFIIFDGEDRRTEIDLPWGLPSTDHIGETKPFVREITLPRDAVPSTPKKPARLRIQRQFECPNNPLHLIWPIVTNSPDMPFAILPREPLVLGLPK